MFCQVQLDNAAPMFIILFLYPMFYVCSGNSLNLCVDSQESVVGFKIEPCNTSWENDQ